MTTIEFTSDDAPVNYSNSASSAWSCGAEHGARTVKEAIVKYFESQGRHAEAAEIETAFIID